MGSKASASTVFLISLNLVFFSLVSSQTCPQDLGVCQGELTGAFFGAAPNPTGECCSRFQGLTDAEATACMCQILKANRSQIPVSLNTVGRTIMRYCGRNPDAFNCV